MMIIDNFNSQKLLKRPRLGDARRVKVYICMPILCVAIVMLVYSLV